MRGKAVLATILFLTSASCYSSAMMGDRPGGIAGIAGAARSAPCRVIARTTCATEQCRGANMDLVTYQCAGSVKTTRCVASFACTAQ